MAVNIVTFIMLINFFHKDENFQAYFWYIMRDIAVNKLK